MAGQHRRDQAREASHVQVSKPLTAEHVLGPGFACLSRLRGRCAEEHEPAKYRRYTLDPVPKVSEEVHAWAHLLSNGRERAGLVHRVDQLIDDLRHGREPPLKGIRDLIRVNMMSDICPLRGRVVGCIREPTPTRVVEVQHTLGDRP